MLSTAVNGVMIINNNYLMRIVLFLGLLAAVTLAIIYRDQFDAVALETWVRDAGREAVTGGEGMIQKGLLALVLLAVVAFLPRLIGNMRRGPMIDIPEFRRRLDTDKNLLVLDVRTPADFVGEQGHMRKR